MVQVTAIFAVALLAMAAKPSAKQSAAILKERYLSPLEIASSPDGRLLYVVCQDSDEVRVVDVQSTKVVGNIQWDTCRAGSRCLADGRRIYVTNAWSDNVSVIDTAALQSRADNAHRVRTNRGRS